MHSANEASFGLPRFPSRFMVPGDFAASRKKKNKGEGTLCSKRTPWIDARPEYDLPSHKGVKGGGTPEF